MAREIHVIFDTVMHQAQYPDGTPVEGRWWVKDSPNAYGNYDTEDEALAQARQLASDYDDAVIVSLMKVRGRSVEPVTGADLQVQYVPRVPGTSNQQAQDWQVYEA